MALHKNDYKCCQLIVSIEFLILCKYKKAQFIEIDITHTFIYSFFLHYIKAQVWWEHFLPSYIPDVLLYLYET